MVGAAVKGLVDGWAQAVQRIAQFHSLRIANFSAHPALGPVLSDCQLVAALCSAVHSAENGTVCLSTQSGVQYGCSASAGAILQLPLTASNATAWITHNWPAFPSTAPMTEHVAWLDRCLSDFSGMPAAVANATQFGYTTSSAAPFQLQCTLQYQHFLKYTGPARLQVTEEPAGSTLSFPIYNEATVPQRLLAVGSVSLPQIDFKELLLRAKAPVSGDVQVVLVHHDGNPAVLGATGAFHTCTGSSYSSLLDACDPELAALGHWLAGMATNGTDGCCAPSSSWTWRSANLVWDVFPVEGEPMGLLVAVATNTTHLPDEAAVTERVAQQALWLLQEASGDSMKPLSNVSTSILLPASPRNQTDLADAEAKLTSFIVQLPSQHHSVLISSISNVCAILAGIVIVVAATAMLFINRLTRSLGVVENTIQDVAAMRFGALMLQTGSVVTEVQRLQEAFVLLVNRLLEYRSFIPAGLFRSTTEDDFCDKPRSPSSRRTSQQTQSRQVPVHMVLPHQRSLTPTSVLSRRTSPIPKDLVANSPSRMNRRNVAVMVVNALGFRTFVAVAGESHMEYVLGHYVATVHDFVSKARGHVDVVLGDQLFVTFNAHFTCPDAHTAATGTALDLRTALTTGPLAGLLRVQIGVSVGQVLTGCTGYLQFKTLVTVGAPMKVAAAFAHLSNMDGSVVLIDPAVEERVRYSFKLRPVDAVHFPLSGQYSVALARAVTIFLVESRIVFQEAEWIYQVRDDDCCEGWPGVFANVLAADTQAQAGLYLRRHLAQHPDDFYALRLQSRLQRWCPKRGVELHEGPDLLEPEPPLPYPCILSMPLLEELPTPLFPTRSPQAR
eukprot:GGOE01004872.1.p1 GENE.GGOE01004872.1~~GGOE01004872.1.p1  ORF type:complete len:976 (+),score=240.09 GGOE01004872.1:412-2928(+)